ncbi:MAG: hypothetical protein A6F71_07945 [Cycloclasticus sp. symbiont of Poecilosclerida sp. M]|nr:MAG: hypothetical protein A6F71_07945 [Cycloclasticus sp. symbiont of Poecilosclerida sp. M]
MKKCGLLLSLLIVSLGCFADDKKAIPSLHGAGDDKTGYSDKSYTTNSKALSTRVGKKTDLIAFIKQPPLGLPPTPVPSNNPVTVEKVSLGRKLFFDRRLSLNNTFSCAMCQNSRWHRRAFRSKE